MHPSLYKKSAKPQSPQRNNQWVPVPKRWAPTGLKNVMGQLDTLVIVILHMRSLGRFKYNVPQNYYFRGD